MKERKIQILAIVFAIVLLVTAVLAVMNFYSASALETTRVERVFLDINGDGLVDLLIDAEVVLNAGPLSVQPGSAP